MKATAVVIALLIALACLCVAPAAAQSLRAPTPQERAILTNYVNVLHSILDQIPNENWVEDGHRRFDVDEQAEVSNDPDVPLDINESMTREYIIRSGSPLEQERVKVMEPLLEKFNANPTDSATLAAIQKAGKPTRITVNVHFNRLGNPLAAVPAGPADLRIPGPAFAARSMDSRGNESAVLLYGNWKAGNRYRFRRPGRYPAIENIVIDISGDPDRINQLILTLDWKVPNSALTP